MEYKQFINLIKLKKQTVLIITAMFLIVVSLITVLQPLRYSATSRLLVVQNYGPNTDAYNVSRSNQFLSDLLAQVVYSDSFYEKVLTSGYVLNQNIFSADANKRKKEWQDAVYTKAIADTGMITLKTYHQDKNTADKLNQAISYTLMTKHSQFHGLGENVKVKIIDNSTLSDWPVKPNVALNLVLALFVGLAASLYFIYLFPNLNLGFKRKPKPIKFNERLSYNSNGHKADLIMPEPEPEIDYGWQPSELSHEPEFPFSPDYEPAENLNDDYLSGQHNNEKPEKINEDYKPYFQGNINNLFQK